MFTCKKIVLAAIFCIVSIKAYTINDSSYKSTLLNLCDLLLNSQINDSTDSNYGALVCPSENPDMHPIHSRAAEAVYPFALAYKLTGKIRYRDAAIRLGNWLISIQVKSGKKTGGWSENWPDPKNSGWFGTTADQLISMLGAYPILKSYLTVKEKEKWNNSFIMAADHITATFPIVNINYNAIGAAALVFAYQTANNPKGIWLKKADTLMNVNTLSHLTHENFLVGEGNGVDEGYNIAQSIGYIALYGQLTKNTRIRQIAANMLKTHFLFVYPNGSVDNSWGTRSYKWTYESGTKTAPGVYFSFALLADMDPRFNSAGRKCLEYLNLKGNHNGVLAYGPHSYLHPSSNPTCNYQEFTRAQCLALAIDFGTDNSKIQAFPAQQMNWHYFFRDLNVTLIKTEKIMATVSAYGEISRYPRESICKGGSISNLWFEGFGENGFFQSSSNAAYKRIEPLHMPNETNLLALTPRVECKTDSDYYTNIFEAKGKMEVHEEANSVCVSTNGQMRDAKGDSCGVKYSITNIFYSNSLKKIYTLSGSNKHFQIIEPIVKDAGTIFKQLNDSTVSIKPVRSDKTWELKVENSSCPFTLTTGNDSEKYWSPFPGIEAYPICISFSAKSNKAQRITVSIGYQ